MEGRTQELLSLKKLEEKDPFDCGTSTGFSLTSVGLKQYIYIYTYTYDTYIYIYIYGYPFTNTPWVPRTLLQHAPFAVVRDDPGGVNMIWRPGTLKGFRGKMGVSAIFVSFHLG